MTEFTSKIVGGHILHVPPAHAIHGNRPIGICTVVVNAEGELCGHPSYNESERLAHSSECARRHASAINAYRLRTHPEIMRPWDPELESYVSQHRVEIATGRKPMPRG